MSSERFRAIRAVAASALVALFAVPQSLAAQVTDHIVTPTDLQKAAVGASEQREHNLETLRSFLSSARATEALKSAHMDPQQVNKAVSSLSDQDLARLSARASKAQMDFAAGNISDRDLLIILVAVAALILIIVAVH